MSTATASRSEPRSALTARSGARGRLRDWGERHDGLVAILVYVAISMFWFRGVVAHMEANCACGLGADPGDNADFVWWFEWFVHAIGHGLPLMHPTVIWSPTGIDMFGTTASLLLAAVSAPLTLIWGPMVSYNVVMILAPAVSAWGANRLCRYVTGSPWPSLLAGATFGFSSYEIAHMVGHLQMVVMVCPPLAALCALRLIDGRVSNTRFVVQMSVLLILQSFLSVEVLFTMTVVGVLALGAAWWTGDPAQRRQLVAKLPVMAIPFALAGLVSSWYLVQVLSAPAYANGAGELFPTDALSFVIPTPNTSLGGGLFEPISAKFQGNWNETNAYLGVPLLLIVGRYLFTSWRTRTARVLAILIGLTAAWILGPVLYIAGQRTIRLPYSLISNLPLFHETLQGRIAVYLSLLASVVLALWLARPRHNPALGWACGFLVLLSLLPNMGSARATTMDAPVDVSAWTNPAFFRTSMYTRYLKRNDVVLPIRWGYTSESYMWQAEDHMYWRMANGYWIFWPSHDWRSQLTLDLWENSPSHASDGRMLRDLIVARRVSGVVVQDDDVATWRGVIRAAGLRQTADVGGVTIYHVPKFWLSQPAS